MNRVPRQGISRVSANGIYPASRNKLPAVIPMSRNPRQLAVTAALPLIFKSESETQRVRAEIKRYRYRPPLSVLDEAVEFSLSNRSNEWCREFLQYEDIAVCRDEQKINTVYI